MSAIKGDFIGFTFGTRHSSELGIDRVSNGSRYTETLLPEFSNKTVNVPGANRVDYLGMEFTQKSFPLDIAFDSVTEEQLREMKKLFSTNKPLPLVFDESPYKTWYAKVGGNPSFNYVCFDEENVWLEEYDIIEEYANLSYYINTRASLISGKTMKITITVQFDPNGTIKTVFNEKIEYNKEFFSSILTFGGIPYTFKIGIKIINNKKVEVKLYTNYDGLGEDFEQTPFYGIQGTIKSTYNKRIYKGEGKIDLVSFYPYAFCDPNYVANLISENTPDNLYEWLNISGLSETQLDANQIYNPGDFDTPFWIKIPSSTLPKGTIKLKENTLSWSASGSIEDGLPKDIYIVIDGRNQLIEGYSDDGVKSGRIYNKFITEGNWFNIPKDQEKDSIKGLQEDWELNYKILYI